MGTGTGDMIRRCRETGLPEPEFTVTDGFQIVIRRMPAPLAPAGEVTGEVAGEVTSEAARLQRALIEMTRPTKRPNLVPTWRVCREELNRAPLAHEEWKY